MWRILKNHCFQFCSGIYVRMRKTRHIHTVPSLCQGFSSIILISRPLLSGWLVAQDLQISTVQRWKGTVLSSFKQRVGLTTQLCAVFPFLLFTGMPFLWHLPFFFCSSYKDDFKFTLRKYLWHRRRAQTTCSTPLLLSQRKLGEPF